MHYNPRIPLRMQPLAMLNSEFKLSGGFQLEHLMLSQFNWKRNLGLSCNLGVVSNLVLETDAKMTVGQYIMSPSEMDCA